ncbi:interaptin isoform X2 [Acyrthosiphon pisum]|uniref:Leucine-rich repeat-containing protein DDB_G0290503 n=1 Tax=Acyrthosiphon pisum TaxID=7029 RepID=A0A8R2D623_ACYPI|nr:interaptin isoform X2 [Acyrthosiphon pisum]|eukprot:XP_016662205.1 PREDICTED: interaptin isoform X2 [Acyrthosiphon pisum]
MENFESIILRWMCLFDEFKNNEYSNTKHLISSTSFKQFADDVFCLKCSSALSTDDTKVYNTIKVNYCEFEVLNYEDLYNEDNAIYACVIVLLHALLKCTNDKFRNQLSERMNNEEQVLLANFLEATQSLLFTKKNISEALLLISDSKHTCINVSEICSNNDTPIKSKSMHRSYLQEFCQSPKSQSLINQEKEKLIIKLTEDYKNECEENYKLAENVKYFKDLNTKLSNKLEDKDKILQILKDEIKEYSKPNQSPECLKVDNDLTIKKLNRDKIDLEMNCNELKQQVTELDKKHKDLNGKFEKKTLDYNNLILMFDNIENENMKLKSNLKLFEETIQKKDIEITSLKDELCNKSITNNPTNISGQETNVMSSNTLFNELSCLKLEEITHDKEKYRHKYKSIKKDLSNTKIHVKELNEKIIILERKLDDHETHKNELIDRFSNKIKELQEYQKKNNNLESTIKHLKDTIKDNENHIQSLCSKLNKREKQIELLSVEIDSVKKSKTMIELILSKTNTEIEAVHEEHDEKVKKLQSIIDEYKNSEKLSHQNIMDLENNIKNVQDNLANKEHIIIFYEEKMAENYQIVGTQEEQLKTMYQEKLMLESHLKNIKIEIETQQKSFSEKNCEMENCLEYYLDELKDLKDEKSKIANILQCKQNEIEQQLKLINNQKDIIKTLQSEQCRQQLIINNLDEVLQQKSSENNNLCAKVLESTLDLDKLKEQLDAALVENNVIKTNLRNDELQIKTMNEEFQFQLNDMKNILENQNNQCLIRVEKLQDTLEKKQNDFNEQLMTCNKLTETISQLHLEKYELEEKLISSGQELNQKQIQFEKTTEENNKLKETVDYTENQCINLQQKLKELENIMLQKEEEIKLFKVHISDCSVSKESLQKQIIEVQHILNNKHIELENQIQCCNEQIDNIIKLNDEKEYLNNKIKNLEQITEVNNKLKETVDYTENQCINLQQELKELKNIISECSVSKESLQKQIIEVQQILNDKHIELENQILCCNEQRDTIIKLNDEKEYLNNKIKNLEQITEENNKLKETVDYTENQCINLQQELKESKNIILQKDEEIKLFKVHISECSVFKESLQKQIIEVQQILNDKHIELENQILCCNEQRDTIIKLNDEKEYLNNKIKNLEQITEENNKLKETVDYTENQCINLQQKLKESKNIILQKDEEIKLFKVHISECSVSKESLQKQIIEVQHISNNKHIELENQIQCCNEQRDSIIKLNDEKECLSNKIKNLEDSLTHNEYKFNLCEGKLYDCSNTIENLETKINTMNNEKSFLELQLNETITKLTNKNQDLTLKLEIKETNVLDIQEKLIIEQNDLKKQIEKSNEQIKTISLLNADKDRLEEEINKLLKCMSINEYSLKSLQEKVLICEKEYEELQTLKTNLVSELNESQLKLTNLHQESKKKLEDMDTKYIELQEKYNKNQVELSEYIIKYNTHMKTITDLISERDNLINKTDALQSALLDKDNVITANQEKLLEYEEMNDKIIIEKAVMEVQLENIQHNLTQKLEATNKKLKEVEVQLINQKEELDKQNKCSIEQAEKNNLLMYENNNLVNETNKLKECLVQREFDLGLNQNKLQDLDKQNKEIECQNMSLMMELNELKCQLNNLSRESTEEIDKMDKKLLEAQKQLSHKQSEIKLKNDSITDIYQKIKYLKDVKVELESIIKKEKKQIEICFETCLNYSFDYIKNNPIVDHHHDSLIEVITSADTFIEQNGIQLARVENCDVNSIIERVKKIFEALKMFIINLKTQGIEQIMNHTNNESNEAYTELLALSKTQQETIKHLETEMSTLKTECVYKMTKVQQKTQEYVTSEYEKKFERKREQMKQFCKDLEAKIHQDFEAKLLKYKDKITKDEIHIKELGQQLWEVSEKYLRLQQKDRRESTMSLPFEMSIISETATTLPKYNSFTLPKSSSAGQIRSLVEETTRCYPDSKRNVPAGIGKIFPKEEDEEGEMFNHSCLADLKEGKVRLNDNKKQYNERLSELQARNSLCPPHLRSCYAAETNFLPNTSLVTEEDIKTTANYSDYETENLIPNDRTKKKDRNQTSYKKPGPPTPSKNGGRVSLSNNAKNTLKESKESNTNKRRASSTPNKLFSLFMSKKN